MLRIVGIVFGVLAFAGTARAQPCASYEEERLGEERVRAMVFEITSDLAVVDAPSATALARVAAYARLIEHALAVDRELSICERLVPSEAALFRAIGLEPASPVVFWRPLRDRCVTLIRTAHVPGPAAHVCLANLEDPAEERAAFALPRPPPPERWTSAADPSAEHAAMARELRARPRDEALRLALARVELASADFGRARRTLGSLRGFDAELLRALAVHGTAPSATADQRLLEAMRALAAAEPGRIEPHVALATVSAGEEALRHAHVAACLAGSDAVRAPIEQRAAWLAYEMQRPDPLAGVPCGRILAGEEPASGGGIP